MAEKKILVLCDMDNTLTPARQRMTPDMEALLAELRALPHITLGVVGGSDMKKQEEQCPGVLSKLDYLFAQNGLDAYKDGKNIHRQNLAKHLGEERLQQFVNAVLRMVADLEIPCKRGTFLELRDGMINVSPIGRNCSQEERDEFEKYDKEHGIRKGMVEKLRAQFGAGTPHNLQFSVGGQISFDVFPQGWSKTYCLQFVEGQYDEIHFFGDKTDEGGNDHEIYADERTIGYSVNGYQQTMSIMRDVFFKK